MRLMLNLFAPLSLRAAETWPEALSRMPLAATNVDGLTETNCVRVMLAALQASDTVKALVFMPGSTDEFYLFHRAHATFTNSQPSLLDAVSALTNQTEIRATFLPPLLLLHTDEDPIEPLFDIRDEKTAAKIRAAHFVPHGLYNDRDWNFMLPILRRSLHCGFRPRMHTTDSWHFYRHSVAMWNLNGWEALEAVSLAGKEKVRVEHNRVIFEGDTRVRARPRIAPVIK